jgi:small subunit ribosomal protein S17
MERIVEKNLMQRGHAKEREGVVVRGALDKTVAVRVTRLVKDPQYGKYIKRTKKYLVHDKNNECQVGDTVRIVETRPLSKCKRWCVREIISKAV